MSSGVYRDLRNPEEKRKRAREGRDIKRERDSERERSIGKGRVRVK